MELDVNLLLGSCKLATLFDVVSINKAFHFCVIMFTYLGLVGAWVYYRNHANDEEEVDAGEISNKSVEEWKEELEQAEGESNLAARSLSIEHEEELASDSFKQEPSFEQGVETAHIPAIENVITMQRKGNYEVLDGYETLDPLAIKKDCSVLNREGGLLSNIDHEEILIGDQISQVIGKSCVKDCGEAKTIENSENDTGSQCFECDSRIPLISTLTDKENFNEFEQENDNGSFSSFDVFSEGDEGSCYGKTDMRSRVLSDVPKDPCLVTESFDREHTTIDCENPFENDIQLLNLLPIIEKRADHLDDECKENLSWDNCLKHVKDEVSICSSNDASKIDFEELEDQISNFNQLQSMIDSVEKYGFPQLANESGATVHQSEVIESEIFPNEVPPFYYGVFTYNGLEAGDSIPEYLEKCERINSGFGGSKHYTSESEDNISANGKIGTTHEEEDFDEQNNVIEVLARPFPDYFDNKKCTDFKSHDDIASVNVDGEYLSLVNESLCKQLIHTTDTADINNWIYLLDEDGSENQNEAEVISNEECGVSDGYSERRKGKSNEIRELNGDTVSLNNFESKLPIDCDETYGESSDIYDSLNCISSPVELSDTFDDDDCNESYMDSCPAGREFEQLPDEICLDTDTSCEPAGWYNDSINEPSDTVESCNDALEIIPVVASNLNNDFHDRIQFEGDLDDRMGTTPEEKVQKVALEVTLSEEIGLVTVDTPQGAKRELELSSSLQCFEEDDGDSLSLVEDARVELKESFIEDDHITVLSEDKIHTSPVVGEAQICFLDEEEECKEIAIDEMQTCFHGSEDETKKSIDYISHIDYELTASSGAQSEKDNDEGRPHYRNNESEGGTGDSLADSNFDIRANIAVLNAIEEIEETCTEGVMNTNIPTTAKDDNCVAVVPRGRKRWDWNELVNTEQSFHIQVNRREIALALSCYPASTEILHHLKNVLFSPGVFVDVFNNIPFLLFYSPYNADRIAEFNSKELSVRSHLALLATNRDANLAKEICDIIVDVDSYFNSFKIESKRRKGYEALPGHFGISFTEKVHYNELKELAPIVCDSNPTLDSHASYAGWNNTFPCNVIYPAINSKDSNKFDSGEIFNARAEQIVQFNNDSNEKISLTTLAAVGDEEYTKSGSAFESFSKYLVETGTGFLESKDLKAQSKRLAFGADVTAKENKLKRKTGLDEKIESKQPHLSLESNTEIVSQSTFDRSFESKYEFSDSPCCFQYNDAIVDSKFWTNEDNSTDIDFDLLPSNSLPLADFNSGDFLTLNCDKTQYSETSPKEFETRDRAAEGTPTCEEMGQVQSVVFTKGTLAMPVSNYSLRGVSVRNQGEYAIINYKITRSAPLISVDKRLQITIPVPKRNPVVLDRRVDHGAIECKKGNEPSAEKDKSIKIKSPINAEILNEFISAISRDGMKISVDPYFGEKNNQQSFIHADIETIPSKEDNSGKFSSSENKIVDCVEKFDKVSCQKELMSGDKVCNSDDKVSEILSIQIFDDGSMLYPVDEKLVKSKQLIARIVGEDLNEVSKEEVFCVEEHKISNVSVNALLSSEENAKESTCDGQVAAGNLDLGGVIVCELAKNTRDDVCDAHKLKSAANDLLYFETPVVSSNSSDLESTASSHSLDTPVVQSCNNDVQIAVKIGCFGDFSVTNPDIDNEQIQSLNNYDSQIAVNGHEELSASTSQHEITADHEIEISDGEQKDISKKFELDGLQADAKIELVDTEDQVKEDNEDSVETESTRDLISVPKYKRVRSKSLDCLSDGLFENMSWFYRDRASSASFDHDKWKPSKYGELRRTKSADVSRRKPRIRLSTNFQRRSIKETNLDELIRSLEHIGPRKKNEVVVDGNSILKSVSENSTKESLNSDVAVKSESEVVADSGYVVGNEDEAIKESLDILESPSKTFRKIVVETKHIVRQELKQRRTMSENIDKNSKNLHESNELMGSVDTNNNSTHRQDQKEMVFSNESGNQAASLGVDELSSTLFMTNEQDVLTKPCNSGQQVSTKEELHATIGTNLEDKASELSAVECNSIEGKQLTTVECREQTVSNPISGVIQQLDSNVSEDKTYTCHDFNDNITERTVVEDFNQKPSEFTSLVNERETKRNSSYGFTVFLSESNQYDSIDLDSTCESDVNITSSSRDEHFWMHQRTSSNGDEKSNEKVSDIDLFLNTTYPGSFHHLDGLDGDNSSTQCRSCGDTIKVNLDSIAGKCDNCEEKEDLQRQKGHEKPRSRSSFRKDRKLRKWLEVRQSSMNLEEKAILGDMDVSDQSSLLRKIALSKGIEYNDHEQYDIKRKKRPLSLRSRQFDFLEQLRYLINFEDDDYNEHIKNLEVNEKENDAIKLLREYEACRQLKKGKSPMVSDDEGSDSDAFTDITDATFSDYAKSRQSLNSLFLSQGSLYKSGHLMEEIDYAQDSFGKELPAHLIEEAVSNSTPQKESYVQRSTSLGEEMKNEGNMPVQRNNRNPPHEDSISNFSKNLEVSESVEKEVAAEFYSMDDVNGLIRQGNSAVRNRRGRTSRPMPVFNFGGDTNTEVSTLPPTTPLDSKFDNAFVESHESKTNTSSYFEVSKQPPINGSISWKSLTEPYVYEDSPCSILTERLNDASYENLRIKLLNTPNARPNMPWPDEREQSYNRSQYSRRNAASLHSSMIQSLNCSPKQQRRATSLRHISTDHRIPSVRNKKLHSVPASPPRFLREEAFRKSTGSYNQRRKEFRSLPDLVTKHEARFSSPFKSLCSSGGSSTSSLHYHSPRSPMASLPRSARRSPFRSPLRSPRLSDLEDEVADTDTVFSDQTGFFSDSSIDIGMTQDGYVDDNDFFLPTSMLSRNLSQNFDDFMAHGSDGGSSGEYFVPLNTRPKRPESRLISCAFGSCHNRDFVDWSQRSRFTSCVSCFTYYCSKECRRAHWNEHKLTCHYGRINYYMKALVRYFETNVEVNEKLSRMALEGLHESGRGCVSITFTSPMAAKFFLVSSTNSFVKDPSYATTKDIMNEGIITKHKVLLQQTIHDYNPEIEFVTNLTVFAGKQNEIQASTPSRFKSKALLRCAKVPLNSIFLSSGLDSYPETSYDIKVFYLPRSKNHHFINDTEARRYYCREVSYGLRKYGIILKRDYPEAYDKLCLYVEHDVEFVPITLYGQSNDSNYKCIIFPEGFSDSSRGLELQGRGILV